jgi:beta-1,4-mannosyl-glycoprotein beta-1,4-N-acetylglucosaminyltransferase
MIYDCFTFFNEFEILDIRLHTLNNVVDKFVLVESNTTHSGQKKPLYFDINKEKFNSYLNKIIHVVIDDMDNLKGDWTREKYQRNSIMNGLKNLAVDEDIILISDVDEIPNPKLIIANLEDKIYGFEQRLFYFYLNYEQLSGSKWVGTKMLKYKILKEISPDYVRVCVEKYIAIKNGGWHFSYLGNIEQIKYKIQSFAHQEFNKSDIIDKIEENIKKRQDIFGRDEYIYQIVPIDDSFPEYIVKNKNKFFLYIEKMNKKEREIYINRIKQQRLYFAQLFIDDGSGFRENNSLLFYKPYDTTSIEFDISIFHKIKQIRFDPLNEPCIIEIENVELIINDESIIKVDLQAINFNLKINHEDYFFHNDPIYIIKADKNIMEKSKTLRIHLKYLYIGYENILNKISEEYIKLNKLMTHLSQH